MIWLYNILLTLLSLIWVPWMLYRSKKRKEGVDWGERTGKITIKTDPGRPRIWVHAVSVGEAIAAKPILEEVRRQIPEAAIILSVTTSSGHKTAHETLGSTVDQVIYFPIDVPRFVLASLGRVRPAAIGIMETELWMNFLDVARSMNIPTLLLNGRISDRSYPRMVKLRFFYRALLDRLGTALMQTTTDAERIRSLGAQNVEVLGNAKFDQEAASTSRDWRKELGVSSNAFVIVIGSTRSDLEEEFVLNAVCGLEREGVVVIHAPRHLERTPRLAELVRAKWGEVGLRSKGEHSSYLLLDTFGELSEVYSAADVAVIGGGFDNLGGQNLLQPLSWGIPVVHGVHMHNFADVTQMALQANASIEVSTSDELRDQLNRLRADSQLRFKMGDNGRHFIAENSGAARKYATALVAAARNSIAGKSSASSKIGGR